MDAKHPSHYKAFPTLLAWVIKIIYQFFVSYAINTQLCRFLLLYVSSASKNWYGDEIRRLTSAEGKRGGGHKKAV